MNNTTTRTTVDLTGKWLYRQDTDEVGEKQGYDKTDFDRSDWKPMRVPNNWYLTEIGQYDGIVWFQRNFTLKPEMLDECLTLRFGAVDYIAKVWLNGSYLGTHEGYFDPFKFDITKHVNDGENCLVVQVDSPRDPTEYVLDDGDSNDPDSPLSQPYKWHWAKDLTIPKGHLIDAMHRPGAFTKYRQDGNTGGIWQPVEIIAGSPIQIAYDKIYTHIVERDFEPDGSALVTVDLEVMNNTGEVVSVDAGLRVTPSNFEDDLELERIRRVELQPGLNTFKLVVTIPDAKLWWTWDHGKPNLYRAELWIDRGGQRDDEVVERFGVKDVVHDDATGHWYLNGKKIFVRGMRYYSSMYMSEITPERIKKDLDEMLEMDINSIRIGSHVELDVFYDFCDEMGFLVWQNFPLHYCYSDSDELIERASVMMRQMVRMLHNHACIGMWSVFKEPEITGIDPKPNNYGRLCEILYETAKTVDPIRWMHKGDYREGVQNVMYGCCQPGDTDLKNAPLEPNLVEFGSHALPPLKSLKKIIPEKDLWPPNWDVWEYWCFYYKLQLRHTGLKMTDTLEELIEQSQSLEAKMIKEQIEFFRQKKYAPVGLMYLYYWSDPAPVIGSGIVDYFGEKLPAYYSMKSVYTPVLVSLEWNKTPYIIGYEKIWNTGEQFVGKVWGTNDHHREIPATLTWEIVNVDNDTSVMNRELEILLPSDASQVVETFSWQIPEASQGQYEVRMEVKDDSGDVLSKNYFDFTVA